MRSLILSAVAGIVGLAALATSAPSIEHELETCKVNATTVFVTVPEVSTVTVHDAPTTIVYLSVSSHAGGQLSSFPTTTLTYFYTSTHTIAAAYAPVSTSSGNDDQTYKSKITYETTVTKTTVVETVYLTFSSILATGPLSFMVSGGTTYWAGGIAPPSTASYVVVTSAVTVLPVVTPISSDVMHTRTTTIHTTIISGHQITITKTLPGHSVTATLVYGTAIPFTGLASGGWNVSAGFDYGTSKPTSSNRELVFITEQSRYDLSTTRFSENLAASTIKSGFALLSTYSASSTSTADGVWTSAMGSTQNLPSGYNESTVPQYANSTSTTSSMPSTDGAPILTVTVGGYSNLTSSFPTSLTSSAMGVFTSVSSFSNVTSCLESAIKTSGFLLSGLAGSSSAASTSAISTASDLGDFWNSTINSQTSSTGSTDGIAVTSTTLHSSYTHAPPIINSTAQPSTALSATGVVNSILPVPSSFLTIYSSVSSFLGNATVKASELASSSFGISSSVAYNYAAGPPMSVPGSSTGNDSTALGAASTSSLVSQLPNPTYAVSSPSSPLASLTSSSIGVVGSSSNSLPTVYIPSSDSTTSTSTFSAGSILSSSFATPKSSSYPTASGNTTNVSQTATASSSSASASHTQCGETGDFTLNFDDIPPLVATNDTSNTVQPAPVFNPYHQFDFSDGFTVVPPPKDPYLPSSKPLLTEFIPNFNVLGNNTQSGPNTKEYGFSGDIGNGDHGLTGCFSFNFYGAAFGCDSRGPNCDFTFTGFRYDASTKQTNQVAQQGYAVPACPALSDCSLTPVKFTDEFLDLDSIRINVTVTAEPKIWWMDDLQLGWFNNTCVAGLCRMSTHIH